MSFAFYECCKQLCNADGGPKLLHMSLQFDGADVSILPFPDNFRPLAEKWISSRTGFSVNLVEKKHTFFADYVVREALDVENADQPPYGSVLGKPGNCILLAMYRLSGGPEMAKVMEEAIRSKGGRQAPTRSYSECLRLLGGGNLACADKSKISVGQRFLIRADGRSAEPHCLSATVEKKGAVKISTGDRAYVHHLSRFKDMLDKAIDKPILLKYSETSCGDAASPNTPAMGTDDPLLDMQAGGYSSSGDT